MMNIKTRPVFIVFTSIDQWLKRVLRYVLIGSLRLRILDDPASPTFEPLTNTLDFLVSHHYHYMPAFYNKATYFRPIHNICEIVPVGKIVLSVQVH